MSAEPESSLPDYLITQQGIFNLQVCTRLTKDDLLAQMKKAGDLESGTSQGWVLTEREGCEPVACQSYPTRRHYLFDC